MSETLPVGIEPSALVRYLSDRGWRRRTEWRGAGVWVLGDSDDLLVPERSNYADEPAVLQRAVRQVASIERRSELDVALDIARPSEVEYFFGLHPVSLSGTIPLQEGIQAFQSIEKSWVYAARAALEGPRAAFSGQRPDQVAAFVKSVHLGVTRPGSYVLTTRIPFGRSIHEGNEDVSEAQEPLARRAVTVFENAVGGIHRACQAVMSGNATSTDVFDRLVAQGVSANLCDAISGFAGTERRAAFEIGFRRSPESADMAEPTSFAFREGSGQVLRAAVKQLRQLAYEGEAVVQGFIEVLQNEPQIQPRVRIRGTLTTGTDEVQRTIWVYLPLSIYEHSAATWHHGDVPVIARGTLFLEQNVPRLLVTSDSAIGPLNG